MVATPTTNITFQNFFSTTLSADITDTATDIFLNAVPNGSEGFLVIEPDSTSNREIIYYTSKTALKVTVPSVADGRGQDDTTAHSHVTGSTVIMAPVAAYYEALLSLFQTTPAGWTSISGNISAVSYNGNRSYDLTTSSDNSAVISPGMRLRTTRTVSAPTQSASLNGSTQYFSKSSPAGMTFTDDFVVSAWVKLSAYPTSTAGIVSRYNGTSGWELRVEATGQIMLCAQNASSANFSLVQSYQSIPLNRWVHVAAQLDMSAFTATTTTSYIMLDGVDVPASVSRGGTNPTALAQAGNLEIGTANGGSGFSYFNGKIAQVAIYSAKVTQANIRATISQGLSGSETSLVSAYSFNNSINDLNASNANNLTANGSAVATNADSPFGGQADGTISSTLDYGIVQSATSSTLVVQVPEGCTIPTSGGVSTVSYSSVKTPYGFPGKVDNWTIGYQGLSTSTVNTPAAGTWYNIGTTNLMTSIPVGAWNVTFGGMLEVSHGSTAMVITYATLSTSGTASGGIDNTMSVVASTSAVTAIFGSTSYLTVNKNFSSATTIYLNISTSVNAGAIYLNGSIAPTLIRAVNAYL
jgi:hypothetical protein